MKRIVWIVPVVVAALACGGGGGGKPGCDDVGSCGAGSYCAHTPDGNVCWPDSVGPTVSNVHLTCLDDPCLRTSTLRVTATVTDDASVGGATVVIGLDGTHPLYATPRELVKGAGDTWGLDVALAELPFPYFDASLAAFLVGRDEAGNEAPRQQSDEHAEVTRLRWRRALATASPLLRSPALLTTGTIVVAGEDQRLHFVDKDGALLESKEVTDSLKLNGPAAVGPDAIWVGGESGSLYWVGFDRALGGSCPAGEAITGVPAIAGGRAMASANGSYVVVADTAGTCVPADVAATASPAISAAGRVVVPAGGKLRNFSIRPNGVLRDEWTGTPASPDIGDVQALLAVDGQDAVWTTSFTGPMNRTTRDGVTHALTLDPTPSGNSTGPIILSDGTAVIGDRVPAVVRRVSSGVGTTWTSPALTGAPAIPLALGGTAPTLLVPTSRGYLYLLRQSDGTVLWWKRVTPSNQALETPNIWTETGAATSTAYLSGADGVLYAVIVDGALDASAPWPKAYHDPQNTSNAGSPL